MDELKPCPFCGPNTAVNVKRSSEFRQWVECYGGCRGPICSSEAEAVTAWKARLTPDAAGIVERLAQFLHDEGGFGDAWTGRAWPEHEGDTGYRGGNTWMKIVPSDTVEHFRDVARRWFAVELASMPTEAATTIAAQAAEIERLRAGMTRAEAAFTLIAGSHWERFGIDQTDVEQVPDLSSDEAMNVARDFLAYDDFPATSQVRHD